jgi:hypothetical protein
VIAASWDGSVAVAEGDSGGPVTAQDSPVPAIGFRQPYVYGVGTISRWRQGSSVPAGHRRRGDHVFTSGCGTRPLQELLAYYQVLTVFSVSLMTG